MFVRRKRDRKKLFKFGRAVPETILLQKFDVFLHSSALIQRTRKVPALIFSESALFGNEKFSTDHR